jgi:hypothetical protein
MPNDLTHFCKLTPIVTKHKVVLTLTNKHCIKPDFRVYTNGIKFNFLSYIGQDICHTPNLCGRVPLEINISHTPSPFNFSRKDSTSIKHHIVSAKIIDQHFTIPAYVKLYQPKSPHYDLHFPPLDTPSVHFQNPCKITTKSAKNDSKPYHNPNNTSLLSKSKLSSFSASIQPFNDQSLYTPKSMLPNKYVPNLTSNALTEKSISTAFTNLSIFALNKQLYVEKENYNAMTTSNPKIYSQFYILTEKKKWEPVVGLFDTGSDISLIEESCMKRIFSKSFIESNLVKSRSNVKSFTETQIISLGTLHIEITFDLTQEKKIVPFMIFKGMNNTNILLGHDIIGTFRINLQYTTSHKPQLFINNKNIRSFYIPPESIDTCYGKFKLMPFERKMFYFEVCPAFTLLANEKILVYEKFENDYFISATLSPYLDRTKVAVAITNRSNKKIEKHIRLSIKSVPQSHELYDKDNWPPPKSCMLLKPIVNNVDDGLRPLKVFKIEKTNKASIFRINVTPKVPAAKGLHTPGIQKSSKEPDPVVDEPALQLNDIDNVTDEDIIATQLYDKYQPKGYEIPIFSQIEDIINLKEYPKIIRNYVQDIFIDKYSDVISLHPYHIGKISDTLGFVKIDLKKNVTLPPFKRIYYLQETENQHLKDILDYLVAADVITRCGVNDGSPYSGFSSPAYLVERACPEKSSYRLIVNYRFINSQIHTNPPVLPSMQKILQDLHGAYIFSSFDLSSAFYCLTLDKKSRPITRFTCAQGSYEFKRLPMGLAVSPQIFVETGHKIVNFMPILDKAGNPVRDANNLVQMKSDPLQNCSIFFDDILVYTKFNETIEKTYQEHFNTIERVVYKLHFHKCTLSWHKTKLCQTSIKHLGWIVEQNNIRPDPARISKILEKPFPATKKGQRIFLGLLNTLRQISPGNLINEMNVLFPLTSSTTQYKPEQKHYVAFENIKQLLTTTPLYTNLIDPNGKFYLFSDASTSEGASYSAVLAQIQKSNQTYIPPYFNLTDPIHNMLFINKQQYKPIPLYLDKISIPKTKCDPKNYNPILDVNYFSNDLLNYGEYYKNSLFISLRSILYNYSAKFPDEKELRQQIVKYIKGDLALFQLKDHTFNGSMSDLKSFLHDFCESETSGDTTFHIVQALAFVLKRKIVVIIQDEPFHSAFRYFFEKDQKPPVVLGCYKTNKGIIYRPFVESIYDAFNLAEFQNRLQLVYFYSKRIPWTDKSNAILVLEIKGILEALEYFKPLLKLSELTVLTDSRAFFCLYNQRMQKHNLLIERYALRMKQEFPQIKLRFLISKDNIADFLSREYCVAKQDYERIPLKYVKLSKDLVNTIDTQKEYTLHEWENFVHSNDHLLQTSAPPKIASNRTSLPLHVNYSNVNRINASINAITKMDPQFKISNHLAHLLTNTTNREKIISEQKKLHADLFTNCMANNNFTYTQDNITYQLKNGLLMVISGTNEKILLPLTLEGAVLVLNHMLRFHCGKDKLTLAVEQYYIPNLDSKIRKLLASCYDCILMHSPKAPSLGRIPLSSYAMQTVALDLGEDLPSCMGYSHFIVMTDLFSNYILSFPLKKKTANEILIPVLFLLYQCYGVHNIVSDNGACFKAKRFLDTLNLLHIKKIFLSPRNPQGNSYAEKGVHILKLALKKYLAAAPDFNWVQKLTLITKAYNTTPNVITGFSPAQMLYGSSSMHARNAFFNTDLLDNVYPQANPVELHEDILELNKIVKNIKTEAQNKRLQTQNKNLAKPKFQLNDFCILKDDSKILGQSRTLKTKFSPTVYTVAKINSRSLVLQNLTTGVKSLHAMRNLKVLSGTNISSITLPDEIKQILLKGFLNITKPDIKTLSKNTPITILEPPESWLLEDDMNQLPHIQNIEEDVLEEPDNEHEDEPLGRGMRPRKVHFKYSA